MKGKRVVMLTQEQWCIEQGLTWLLGHSTTIGGTSNYLYGFVTGPYWVQIDDRIFQTQSTDSGFFLYRDTAYTGGAEHPIYNRNDNYSNDTSKRPFTDVKHGVSAALSADNLISPGLILDTAGSLERRVGDESSANIFLKPSTSYVFEVRNIGASPALHRWSAHCTQWSKLDFGWVPVRQP